jgi:hypothetical protein
MNRKTLLAVIILFLLAAGGAVLAQSGGGFDLSWNTVDGGGGASSGDDYEVSSTVGQADAGTMSGGSYTLTGGFWGGATCTVADPAVTAARSSGAIELAWTESGGVAYDVYRSTTPYQMPATAYATGVSSPWADPVLGDPSTHHFYWVLGGGCALSQQVAEFEFPLVPGT